MSKSKKEIVIEFTSALLSSKDPGKKIETIPGIVEDAIQAADLIESKFPDQVHTGTSGKSKKV